MRIKFWFVPWLLVAIRLLPVAILGYFLLLKPLIGAGYGTILFCAYLFVFCPALAGWLKRKAAEKRAILQKSPCRQ